SHPFSREAHDPHAAPQARPPRRHPHQSRAGLPHRSTDVTRTRRSWSFRARLTALIAAVFVAGGTALLVVQYLLVHGLFEDAIGSITSCVDDRGVTVVAGADSELDCQTISHGWGTDPDTATASDDDYAVIVEQTTLISEDVLSGLLLWSIVTLLVFTGVAVAVASWLSRRSFARIGQIKIGRAHV